MKESVVKIDTGVACHTAVVCCHNYTVVSDDIHISYY